MDPSRQEDFPAPREGFVLTHFITNRDVARSAAFYGHVLGGRIIFEGEPTAVKLANGWVIINVGGGPTDDKPDVVLEPPPDPHRTSSFLNIRVADIHAAYAEWRRRGAEFLTAPKQHATEIRCYMRDPDGYLIEVGQLTREPSVGKVDTARRHPAATTFGSAGDLAGALRRAEAAHGEHERRTGQRDANWPDWYAAYMEAEQTGGVLPP